MCFDIGHREKFMHLNLARSKFWDFFTKYLLALHNCVKIIILETCLMIIYTDSVESLLSFATISLSIDQFLTL